MVTGMAQTADRPAGFAQWSPREAELLAVTLDLLQEHGYDGLTVDAVASVGRASKATVYRRWPSKAELVLAAFTEGVRQEAIAPDTGTLRGDLLKLGEICCRHAYLHANTIRAVLAEVSRIPALHDVMQHQFIDQRQAVMEDVLRQAVARGEIAEGAMAEELWDLLPGYLIFRAVVQDRPPTTRTVRALVDEFILPGLTRLPAET
ncbi:TetR/AcrR family transcriptional regulator [Mycobacterium sp.]|uniref:TetR/AcrR family transcriptional regulator n=1 Tax=Mycobacterium sp. TaxID=1785 RepID=UPI003A87E2BF